jgi:putative transcriptional regulator
MLRLTIEDVLKERGRSAYWLAKQVGVTQSTLAPYLHNEVKMPSLEMLGRICEALDCQPGDLLARVDGKKRGGKK